jgi:ligand-binding sensor domain-containing protein
MKKLIYLICLLVVFSSCRKHHDAVTSFNTNFSHKILDGYFVTAIAFDHLGNAWIGTMKQGLIKYNGDAIVVYNSTNSIISSEATINDIAVDSKNNVWIGADGLYKYDGTSIKVYNTANKTIPEDYVPSVAVDSKDNVWFSSCRQGTGGVMKYDGTNFTLYTPANSSMPVNFVRSIAIDKNDNVWLAFTQTVLQTYLAKISKEVWTVYSNKELGFSPYYYGNIKTDSKNQLWGAIDYSLSSSISYNRPMTYVFDGNTATQFKSDVNEFGFWSITIDNKDRIWGIDIYGYMVYDGNKWITDKGTFKDKGLYTIEQAPDGKMWMGTGNGVYIND